MLDNCVFCKIGNGEIETEFLYKDDTVCAINDINPVAPVHILIFPLEHIDEIGDEELRGSRWMGHILFVSKKVADLTGIEDSGFRIVINQGSDSGQEVQHLHAHVIGGRPLGSLG